MNWLGRQLRGGPWIRNPNPHFDKIQISRFNIFDARTYLHKENSSIVFHGLCGLNASVFSTFSCVFLMLISWFFCCPPIYIIYRHIERTPGYIFFIFRIFSCSRPVFFFRVCSCFFFAFSAFFCGLLVFFRVPLSVVCSFFLRGFLTLLWVANFFGSVNLLSLSLCQAWRFVRWITAVSLEKEHRFLHFISFFSGAHCYSEWAVHNSIIFIYTYTYKAMSIP